MPGKKQQGANTASLGHVSLEEDDHAAFPGDAMRNASPLQQLELEGFIDRISLSALSARLAGGLPDALPEIELTRVNFRSDASGGLHYDAGMELEFHSLAAALGIPVPDGMARLQFSLFALDVQPREGRWSITLQPAGSMDFPPGAAQQFNLQQMEISFGSGPAGFAVNGRFELAGSLSLGPDLMVSLHHFKASLEQGQWLIDSSIEVQAFDLPPLQWGASLANQVLRLSYDQSITLLDWQESGAVTLHKLGVSVIRIAQQEGGTSWGFGVDGQAKVMAAGGLIDVTARVELDTSTGRLVVAARAPQIPAIPMGPLSLDLTLHELRVSREESWSFASRADMALTGIAPEISRYVPAELRNGLFRVNESGAGLFFATPDFTIDFGPLTVYLGNLKVPLGEPGVELTNIGIVLDSHRALEAHLHIKVPRELNRLLGWDEHFQPTTIFLNESFDLRLDIDGRGIRLALENATSPLRALKVDDRGFCHLDLGEIGWFSFQLPELGLENGVWQGSAAMEHGPLRLPLQPLRFLLKHLGFSEQMLKLIPRSVPLADIDLPRLAEELPRLMGTEVWAEVGKIPVLSSLLEEFFTSIGSLAGEIRSKFPEDLVDYLTIHIPDTIYLDIRTSSRGPSFGLRTVDDQPIRFLLPWLAAMPPELVGVSVREISVGQALGTLGIVKFDGRLDRFDVLTLIAAALPKVRGREFRNRLTLAQTTAVIPSAFPVPIPLFYDRIKWEVRSWTGLGLTSEWHLPAELDLWQTITAMIAFFTHPDFLLHLDARAQAFHVSFQIGPNFIALPDYLGGKIVGPQSPSPVLPLDDSFKRFLDTVKTGNAAYLIEAVPLRHPKTREWIRLGRLEAGVAFGPFGFAAGAGWCICTEAELQQVILPDPEARSVLGELNAEDVLRSIPARTGGAALEKGFVVMLMGHAEVKPVIEARAYFGMALTATGSGYDSENEGGFETGFLLRGTIAELLSLTLGGNIHVVRDGTTTVKADCRLLFAGVELIGGGTLITVGPDLFDFGVTLRLGGGMCTLNGTFHITRAETYIEGGLSWSYAPGREPLTATRARAVFSPSGFALELTAKQLFLTACDIRLYVDARRSSSAMGVQVGLQVEALALPFEQSLLDLADRIAGEVKGSMAEWQAKLNAYQGDMNIIYGVAAFLTQFSRDLPDIVVRIVARQVNDKPGWIKKQAQTRAAGRASAIAGDLSRLAMQIKNADAEKAKSLILGLIQQALDAKVPIDIKIAGMTVYKNTFDPWANNKKDRSRLTNVIATVKNLPAKMLEQTRARDVYQQYVRKQDIGGKIAQAIRDRSRDAVPRLKAISFATREFSFASARVPVTATFVFKQQEQQLSLFEFDLLQPATAVTALAGRVIDELAG